MKKKKSLERMRSIATDGKQLPEYKPPTVVTYTDDELLEALGPAQAGSCANPWDGNPDPNCTPP